MKSSDLQIGFDFDTNASSGGKAAQSGKGRSTKKPVVNEPQVNEPQNEEMLTEEPELTKPHVYSISEINAHIRRRLEGDFGEIWIRGEISNFKPHSSGHFYFSLKDDSAQINAVMFRGFNSKLKFKPDNGLEVLVHGKITVYEPRGNYQVFCEYMEPVGAGALQKAFEQLKEKLNAEGLFAPERKRAIPKYPRHIGIVTSPTGAALQDILNVLRRRYKSAKITLAPALVQGDGAADSLVQALEMINKVKGIDVLIVGRGGGSAEDLWCFNEERLARAIAASKIPTISAVGHEIDFTIADFVADLRAPTPSAAAELVAKSITETLERIQSFKLCLWQCWQSGMAKRVERVGALGRRLVDPQRRLRDLQFRNDELMVRLENAMFRYFEDQSVYVDLTRQKMPSPQEKILQLHKRLDFADVKLSSFILKFIEARGARLREGAGRLDAMSPLRVVERGYSIVKKQDGVIVKYSAQLKLGEKVQLTFSKGTALANIEKVEP